MIKVLRRIIYKYYIVGVSWFVWAGLVMVDAFFWMKYEQTAWGTFMIISGLTLLWSERKFIKECNSSSIE